MKRLDILIWDDVLSSKLSKCFSSYSYTSLSIDSYSKVYLQFLPKSLLITFFGFNRLRQFLSPSKYQDLEFKKKWSFKSLLKASRLLVRVVIDLCPILYFNPRLLITYTDTAKRFHLIDCLLHPYIPVITVQNGSLRYLYQSECELEFTNFFSPPSFHSCFCCLSSIDADLHRSYGWTIRESHVVGSISANGTLKSISSNINKKVKPYIFVVLNSNLERTASKKLAEYIVSYAKSRCIDLVIGVKAKKKSPRYDEYIKKARELYGESAEYNLNSERSDNLNAAINASVVVGCYSTLLREVLSFGVKIYPLNFGHEKLNCHFESLDLPLSPDIDEFFKSLDELIAKPEETYMENINSEMKYIGAYPFPHEPINRLSELISRKLIFSYKKS